MIAFAAMTAATFLYGTLIGWAVHWVMHRPWSGPLFRAHMHHHLKAYPPWDMESGKYRPAGFNDAATVFVPATVVGSALGWGVLALLGQPEWIRWAFLAEAVLVLWLNDAVHEAAHLKAHWMHGLLGRHYWHLRKLHRIHHRNMRRNLGILWFGWDRAFGTFRSSTGPERSAAPPGQSRKSS